MKYYEIFCETNSNPLSSPRHIPLEGRVFWTSTGKATSYQAIDLPQNNASNRRLYQTGMVIHRQLVHQDPSPPPLSSTLRDGWET